ncbi:hypothetical protein DVA86_27775 [Streptomyces armeniacus]|uniref:DUF6545 domain-containing protein n=1 Tax=Streptomyces armeniacus TaxID=83291 RepID=A0A345XW41_9ACTN|nr:MAB_1171c family putative transporter [Streptomyces armeniacus]AXK35857.1 hypothetical protein DVA86_27775 [Streptomyces armeniacus]
MQQLHPLCFALTTVGFVLLLWPPRRLRTDPALAALCATWGFSALSFAVSLEPVWKALDAALGRPSTGAQIAYGSVVALMACQLVTLAYWSLPREAARARARLSLAAAAMLIATLTVLFFQLTPRSSTPQGFTSAYAHTGTYQAYLTLYNLAYAGGEILLAVGCISVARRTGQVWVARGLRLAAVGAVLTLGYSSVRLAVVLAALGDRRLPAGAESAAWICADGGTVLVLAGWFVPTLAHVVAPQVRAWARAHRDFRRLGPLWSDLCAAVPTIALAPARTAAAETLRLRGISWHLYRRTTEIRDGQWALRHYLEASVRREAEHHRQAAGLTGQELAAAVTADQLRHAVRAFTHHQATGHLTEYADAPFRETTRTPDDEVTALLRIADHYTAAAPKWETPEPYERSDHMLGP